MLLNTKQSDLLDRITKSGKQYIVGIDEVGYGCIAGPIFVTAFFAPKNWNFDGLKDSKKLSEKQRQKILQNIVASQKDVIEYATIGAASISIDTCGVSNVLKDLYYRTAAIAGKNINECLVIIDGILKVKGLDHISLPKGDNLVPHIMAASIFAKVARDNHMQVLSERFPQYGWDKNKGYPTSDHLAALKKHGYCEQHRCSYAPISRMMK